VNHNYFTLLVKYDAHPPPACKDVKILSHSSLQMFPSGSKLRVTTVRVTNHRERKERTERSLDKPLNLEQGNQNPV